jgi:tetratricopeptide (TPR) repeat protein
VFSLGIVAWELLAGEHPFPGEGRSRMQAILDGSRRELKVRGLPSGTSDLLRAMLEVHPFKRPTSAKVAEALERLLRPHSLLRWTAASLVSALVLAGAANWFLGRGVIADLTRQRPARLAVLPFLNQSGDSKHDSLVNAILPEMLEAALREQPKLAPLGQEALGRARKDLRMSPSGPLDSHEEARLSVALGAQLVLHGTLTKGADGALTVKYVLSDARGTVRQSGEVQEPAESVAAPLALARKVSADLIKAVDPFASRTRSQLPGLPAPALEAYAKGMELVEHGDFKAAAPAFLVAAQLAPDFAPAILGYARCMGRTGDGNPEPVLQWARWVARAEGNRSDEMFALQSLSVRLGERGQWDAAEKAGHEAMDLAKNLGRTSFEAVVHLSSGVHLQRQHKRPEAEAEYQRSLAMFQSVDDKLNATRALNNLAVLEKERGNLKAAESRYLAALQFVQEYGDKWGEAVYTNNLGDLALAQEGGLDRAEAAFRKAKSIREAIGDHQGLTYTLMGMASVAQARGDLGRAEDLTKQYLEQARKTGLRPMEALALYNLGELNRASLDYPAARGFYRQSMSMHQELKDAVMEALCLAGEAECMAREKHPGMARVLLDRSLSLSTDETPYLLRAQAWLARSEGRNEEAKALFAKALSTARLQAPEIMKELKEASR